ncbi:hypothetical protein GY45DRAFT_46719 [Cubamyces sp. BRFM 1775]|nr:hypothetical protein GY45DRAFT_46719 [Cubamyces sp. BRFM 1775]
MSSAEWLCDFIFAANSSRAPSVSLSQTASDSDSSTEERQKPRRAISSTRPEQRTHQHHDTASHSRSTHTPPSMLTSLLSRRRRQARSHGHGLSSFGPRMSRRDFGACWTSPP